MDSTKEEKIINIIKSIDHAIEEYITINSIDDINKISMSNWNALLIYVNNVCFGNRILKSKELYKTNDRISSNYNAYDYEILDYLCDYYIYLCYKYDKEVSKAGFSKLAGITKESILSSEIGKVVSDKRVNLAKKLTEENEQSLANKLYDGKGNPVGVIAILNHWHNWQTAAAAKGEQKPVLTADQLPDLSLPGGQKQGKPELLDDMHKEKQ